MQIDLVNELQRLWRKLMSEAGPDPTTTDPAPVDPANGTETVPSDPAPTPAPVDAPPAPSGDEAQQLLSAIVTGLEDFRVKVIEPLVARVEALEAANSAGGGTVSTGGTLDPNAAQEIEAAVEPAEFVDAAGNPTK